MRLYVKLVVTIAVFTCASRWQLGQTIADLAYDARAAYVTFFGSAADYEALIDETTQRLARDHGTLDRYLKGKRYRHLLAQRIAAAAAAHPDTSLSEDELERIRHECAVEVFGLRSDQAATISEGECTGRTARANHDWRKPATTIKKTAP